MSIPRVVAFFLVLMSVTAALFALVISAGQFIILPTVEPHNLPAGYFQAACCFVLLIPLSLLPVVAAWVIRERIVRPREAAERQWWEARPWKEERLRAWTVYVSDLLLRHWKL